ncbi:MAG: DNA-binding transcriptional regulator [Planctomycetia bacterium]|nr:DNA-binding transcriptional regulator [Planctomycetia bacterium]
MKKQKKKTLRKSRRGHFRVAILVETINSYSKTLMRGITQYIKEHGPWDISYEERGPSSPPPFWLEAWRGDGIIVRDMGDAVHHAQGRGIPLVDISDNSAPSVASVHSNYAETSRMAAEHLKERFLPHFAFVGLRGRKFSELRKSSFVKYVKGECHVFEFSQQELSQCWTEKKKPFPQWLLNLPKPCGLMACDDLVGLHVLQSCRTVGLRVPDDLSVVGVDDDEIHCMLASPGLTTVSQNAFQVGYQAALMLHTMMRGEKMPERHLQVSPISVVCRESTDTWAIENALVIKALRIIQREACHGLNVKALARELNVVRRTLERQFQLVLKRTLKDEILQTQLHRAKELLSGTDLTLETISKRAGFCSASYMNTVFIRQLKMTAGEYRKKQQNLWYDK